MNQRIEITDNILKLIDTASSLQTGYITISYQRGLFIVAADGVIGNIGYEPITTSHKEFTIQIGTKLALELIRAGEATFEISEDRTKVTYQLFLRDRGDEPYVVSVFSYSSSPAMESMLNKVVFTKGAPLQVDHKLFNRTLYDTFLRCSGRLTVHNNIAFSNGSDLSVYYILSDTTTNGISFDKHSYKVILDNISSESEFFLAGNNYVMRTGTNYVTWRPPYIEEQDLQTILSLKPLAQYEIGIDPLTPLFSFKSARDIDQAQCCLDFKTSTINVADDYCRVSSKFDVKKVSGDVDVTSVILEQKKIRHFIHKRKVNIMVYKKFVRIVYKNCIIDVGGTVNIEKLHK